MPRYRYSLVACARWEETQIQEWVEYHRSIGFDHIYLYSNDDDPAALYRAVAAYVHGPRPYVTFRHWPKAGEQAAIYFHFLENFKQETEWFSFLDIDEFFILTGINNIHAFMTEYSHNTDCLYFQWLVYGNSGHVQRAQGPVLTSYLRRSRGVDIHTKMLCRSAAIEPGMVKQGYQAGLGAFWHFLDNFRLPGVRCRDVLHQSMEGYSYGFPESTYPFVNRPGLAEALLTKAFIAHFQFKSEEDFLRRWRRGGFANGDMWRHAYNSGYYREILAGTNAVYDSYLAEYWHHYTAAGLRLSPSPSNTALGHENVALNKPSWQSSVYEPDSAEPPGSRTAGGGNNGLRSGLYGFHTRMENGPWWIVDLLASYELAEIRIYNRADNPDLAARAAELDILGSGDGAGWTILYSHVTGPFGTDGTPLIVPSKGGDVVRFVMIRLRGAGHLHLDEVEIYGGRSNRGLPLVGTALPMEGMQVED
ncbi:MAG: glycosyltransferase family 2 protein [Proteobacteria bacterium]|nr:glycosyltransferase family 2 protein [Pseudomonadota bacterium]